MESQLDVGGVLAQENQLQHPHPFGREELRAEIVFVQQGVAEKQEFALLGPRDACRPGFLVVDFHGVVDVEGVFLSQVGHVVRVVGDFPGGVVEQSGHVLPLLVGENPFGKALVVGGGEVVVAVVGNGSDGGDVLAVLQVEELVFVAVEGLAEGEVVRLHDAAPEELVPGNPHEVLLVEVDEGFVHARIVVCVGRDERGVSVVFDGGPNQVEVGVRREVRLERGKQVVLHPVVAVGEVNPFALGTADTGIAGGADATVGLVDDLDAGMLARVAVADFPGAVPASVVDQNQFEIAEVLPEDAVEASAELRGHVVDGHHDGNERVGGSHLLRRVVSLFFTMVFSCGLSPSR